MSLTQAFDHERANLRRLAYRMLGTQGDADDMVQETFVRLLRANAEPDNLPAWLTRVCVRLCLDRLKSAQRTRETYPGPWLPEPWAESKVDQNLELDESLSMALLFMLERLNPNQRAAFLLHDIFDYNFDDIADIVGLTSQNCRQLATRARKQICERSPRDRQKPTDALRKDHCRIASAFFAALHTGDQAQLRSVLVEDVILFTDGGGQVTAARRPVEGCAKVALFLSRTLKPQPGFQISEVPINGTPGLVIRENEGVRAALTLEVHGSRICTVFIVRNPDKLKMFVTVQPTPTRQTA